MKKLPTLTPYEPKNLLFIDTEFSDLDPMRGEILSVGIVTITGEELYLEIAHDGPVSDWVSKHIVPTLNQPKVSVPTAKKLITKFIGESQPYAVGFVDNYDVIYLTKWFGAGNLPFRWMTIDLASVLFAIGVNPVKYQLDGSGAKAFYRKLGIDTSNYRQHHALDDARLLRDVWIKLTS